MSKEIKEKKTIKKIMNWILIFLIIYISNIYIIPLGFAGGVIGGYIVNKENECSEVNIEEIINEAYENGAKVNIRKSTEGDEWFKKYFLRPINEYYLFTGDITFYLFKGGYYLFC